MEEVCKFLDVVRSGQGNDSDSILVERCGDFVGELLDFEVRVTDENAQGILQWAKSNLIVNAEHLDRTFAVSKPAVFKMIISMKAIGSFTSELVREAGGVQGFLDKYGKQPEPEPEEDEFGALDFSSDFASSLSRQIQDDLDVFPEDPPDTQAAEPFNDDEEDEDADFEALREQLDGEGGSTPFTVSQNPVSTPNQGKDMMLMAPFDESNVGMAISFSQLNNFAACIIEAAHQLDREGYKVEQALTEEELPAAIRYINDVSPTVCKEFLIEYVRTASNETERIRVSRTLDQFATFVTKVTGGV